MKICHYHSKQKMIALPSCMRAERMENWSKEPSFFLFGFAQSISSPESCLIYLQIMFHQKRNQSQLMLFYCSFNRWTVQNGWIIIVVTTVFKLFPTGTCPLGVNSSTIMIWLFQTISLFNYFPLTAFAFLTWRRQFVSPDEPNFFEMVLNFCFRELQILWYCGKKV